jgi:hypothetical protein
VPFELRDHLDGQVFQNSERPTKLPPSRAGNSSRLELVILDDLLRGQDDDILADGGSIAALGLTMEAEQCSLQLSGSPRGAAACCLPSHYGILFNAGCVCLTANSIKGDDL